jgi:uncharacterized protein YPO0396
MQNNFKAINIRITIGLENDLNILHIQIINKVRQKIDCINLNIRKVKNRIIKAINNDLNRFSADIINRNSEVIGHMFKRVRNLFL